MTFYRVDCLGYCCHSGLLLLVCCYYSSHIACNKVFPLASSIFFLKKKKVAREAGIKAYDHLLQILHREKRSLAKKKKKKNQTERIKK